MNLLARDCILMRLAKNISLREKISPRSLVRRFNYRAFANQFVPLTIGVSLTDSQPLCNVIRSGDVSESNFMHT